MNLETRLLSRLKLEQQTFAVDALKRPVNKDAFEYGYRVGVVAGYEAAINILLLTIDEVKYSDNDL